MHYIYIVQNKQTLKVYVGLTKSPEVRWRTHKRNAKKGKHTRFYCALRSYGIDNFEFQVIEEHKNKEDCAVAECFWIEFFRSWDPDYGYNLNHGGSLGIPTDETRKKMSESAKRRGSNNTGKRSTIACQNIKEGCKKRGQKWLKNVRRGLKHRNCEWRENIKTGAIKRWQNQNEREKMSESNRLIKSDQFDEFKTLFDQGLTMRQMADHFGCRSVSPVSKVAKLLNLSFNRRKAK